jgi:glycosyltransferase involved in cell wall biosynthesis
MSFEHPGINIIWIAWEKHRRTVELCKHFDIELITYLGTTNRLIKYFIYSFRTLLDIIKNNPNVLIIQNPSVFLTFISCLLKPVFGYKLIVDTHNAGILPEISFLRKLSFLYKYFQRAADLTIVTNMNLAAIVRANGGRPFIMPDKLPTIDVKVSESTSYTDNTIKIVYICTFGADEPYLELIDATRHFNEDVIFYVTGNITRLPVKAIASKPTNLIFTGFIPENEYWNLLSTADIIVDLTNREDCLVCGAYEAVAVEVPLILSDTEALRNYFTEGTVFTKNTTQDLIINISHAIENISCLRAKMKQFKNQLENNWRIIEGNFLLKLEVLCSGQNKLKE